MTDDVRKIIEKGIHSLSNALPNIRKLASDEDWKKREDAAKKQKNSNNSYEDGKCVEE